MDGRLFHNHMIMSVGGEPGQIRMVVENKKGRIITAVKFAIKHTITRDL